MKFVDRSRRFRADANIFYYDYSDLQVSAITPIGQATTNATSAEIYGMELQLDARLGKDTMSRLGAQVLKARFKRFPNATCTDFSAGAAIPYAPISCDVTGNRLPFAPKFKFNVGASHQVSLGKAGTLAAERKSGLQFRLFLGTRQCRPAESFATIDASAEWRPNRRGPSVRIWVLNLTDANYYDSLATQPTAGVLQRPGCSATVWRLDSPSVSSIGGWSGCAGVMELT